MHDKRIIGVLVVAVALWRALSLLGQPAPATRPAPATQPAVGAPAVPLPPAVAPVPNPHWTMNECHQCHEMRGNEALPIAPEQTDRICLRCHDGRLAPMERHPVGRPIPSPTAVLPPGWPAPEGRLGCLTCHDLTPTAGHGPTGRPARERSEFLRGPADQSLLAFCNQCHTSNTEQSRHDPHQMLAPDGSIRSDACLFCHTRAFRPAELRRRTGEPSLKTGGLMLCVGCHTQHVDYFEPGHIGAQAPPAIVERMQAVARAARGGQAADQSNSDQSQGKQPPTRLPLGPRNTVVCSTCHNPHQEGVFPPDSELSLGAMPAGHERDANVALRGGAKLCGECHGK